MAIVKHNLIANFFGKAISAVMSIVFVPIYLQFLGAEAYGIVGLFAALQSIFMLADMGLSGTLTREIARLSIINNSNQRIQDLCRTFEIIFIIIGFLVIILISSLSQLIATRWVNLHHLSAHDVTISVVLIGVAIGLQFPFLIYQGILMGLQRQIQLNILLLSLGFIRGIGAIFVLKFINPSIRAFLIWQLIIIIIQLVAGYFLVWRNLGSFAKKSRFDKNLITPLWHFAAGTAGITLTGILLTQSDKLILTKVLPLEKFGYYVLAGVVASVPGMIAIPFSNALYPRFTQLVEAGEFIELTRLYHRSCQFLTVVLLPIGLVGILFSKELILAWTGNIVTAQNTHLLASILMIGSTLMGLMVIPFALQLSFGWTKLGLYFNIIALLILVPLMMVLVSKYGTIGACFSFVALYVGQFTGMIYFMHRRILKEEKWKWYIDDILKPLLAAGIIVVIGRVFINENFPRPLLMASLGLVISFAVCAAIVSAAHVRKIFR